MVSADLWRELEREFERHAGEGVYAFEVVGGGWSIQRRGGGHAVQPAEQAFVDTAKRAAVAAGLSLDDPVTSWLRKLKEGPHYAPDPDPESVSVWLEASQDWVPLGGGCIEDVFRASAGACRTLAADADVASAGRAPFGRNVERLKNECGWSYDLLAQKVGLDRSAIIDHVTKGTKPRASTMKAYADAFSRHLKREISVADLSR